MVEINSHLRYGGRQAETSEDGQPVGIDFKPNKAGKNKYVSQKRKPEHFKGCPILAPEQIEGPMVQDAHKGRVKEELRVIERYLCPKRKYRPGNEAHFLWRHYNNEGGPYHIPITPFPCKDYFRTIWDNAPVAFGDCFEEGDGGEEEKKPRRMATKKVKELDREP